MFCMGGDMDETGNRHGRLLVLGPAPKRGPLLTWLCRCDCGALTVAKGASMRSKNTLSCGCLKRDTTSARAATHRMTTHPAMESYKGAKRRCRAPAHKNYAQYGGRGIEFRFDSFEQFWEHVGASWFPGATLERKENDGHYEPGNVRWATRREQCLNTRRSVRLTLGETTMNLCDWAAAIGISPRSLRERIQKWTLEKALTTPPTRK